MPLTNKAQRN